MVSLYIWRDFFFIFVNDCNVWIVVGVTQRERNSTTNGHLHAGKFTKDGEPTVHISHKVVLAPSIMSGVQYTLAESGWLWPCFHITGICLSCYIFTFSNLLVLLVCQYNKLDGVGPVDNRPSTD